MTEDTAPRLAAIPLPQEPIASENGSAPRRRGRPPRDPNAPRRPRTVRKPKAPLETRVAASLVKWNMGLMVASKFSRGLIRPDDALDKYEITTLSAGLVAQAREHAQFRKALEMAVTATGSADIFMTLGVIFARRAARRGLLPEDVEIYGSILVGDPTHQDELAKIIADAMALAPEGITVDGSGDVAPDADATARAE